MQDQPDVDEELERLLAVPEPAQGTTATPLTVLTGFLGAGKTTLANRILSEDHGLRIAMLVNDFGEVDIDSELIVGVTPERISLANGCVCCEVRDDLLSAVDSLLAADTSIDAIVLEASGVAEPLSIARTFLDAAYANRIRLDGIIAVVDAEQLPAQVEDPVAGELVYGQIGCSDLVLLNKVDLADRERVADVRSFITGKLPMIRIIETVRADVPLDVLVGRRATDLDLASANTHFEHDHDGFVTWVYQRRQPFHAAALHAAVRRLPSSVYRIKGFVDTVDDPGQRMLMQAVGMRAELTPFDPWGDRDPSTTLVIIGSETVDRAAVEATLDASMRH